MLDWITKHDISYIIAVRIALLLLILSIHNPTTLQGKRTPKPICSPLRNVVEYIQGIQTSLMKYYLPYVSM